MENRVVLVTGASSGVGLSTVQTLLGEGALVATCARDVDRLSAALQSIGAASERVLVRACDVRDDPSVVSLVESTVERFGRLDGLVNNAGRSLMKPLSEVTSAQWNEEFDLKLKSILLPTLAALPHLRASDAASIVNINAVLAVQPESRLVATSAARAGVLNLSKSLAAEFAPLGIRVNSVCLGLIDTGQWRRRFEESGSSLTYDTWQHDLAAERQIPLGRLGRSDEVASVVTFLLSQHASYVTGSAIDIAGGANRSMH